MKGPGAIVAVEIHDIAVLTQPFAPVFEIDGFADLNAQTELLKRLHRFTEQAADRRQSAGICDRRTAPPRADRAR